MRIILSISKLSILLLSFATFVGAGCGGNDVVSGSADSGDSSCAFQSTQIPDGDQFIFSDGCNSCRCNPSGTQTPGQFECTLVGCTTALCSTTIDTCTFDSASECPMAFPELGAECDLSADESCFYCEDIQRSDSVIASAVCANGVWATQYQSCDE